MTVRFNSWVLAMCFVGLVTGSTFAARPPGKGGGGKKTEPAVTYEITWLGDPFNVGNISEGNYLVKDMNNSGDFVGRAKYRDENDRRLAFLYTAATGEFTDLNTLAAMPLGWTALIAFGINETGQIAVIMENTAGIRAIFRYDTLAATFTLIHQPASWGAAINNWGDIAFTSDEDGADSWRLYRNDTNAVTTPMIDGNPIPGYVRGINDSLQIVGYTTLDNMIRFDADAAGPSGLFNNGTVDSNASAINNSGDVAFTVTTTKGKGVPKYKPARYDEQTGEYVILRDIGGATGINSSGDVCVRDGNGVAILVFPREGGTVVVDSEVTGDPDDVYKWNVEVVNFQNLRMNDRVGSTGFGQICGTVWVPDGNGDSRSEIYLLTPTQ